jgi:hypothetical protein
MRVVSGPFISALMGGVLGASLVVGLTRIEASPAPQPPSDERVDLARRLDAVERALASDEPRVRALPPTLASTSTLPTAIEPVAAEPAGLQLDAPAAGAVLDAEDRADRARAARRDVEQQREAYVTNELTLRLGLSPAQTERLRAIQTQLDRQLERERRGPADGRFPPPEARRAARDAMGIAADDQLRSVLAPRQVVAYDALAPELKLYRAGR